MKTRINFFLLTILIFAMTTFDKAYGQNQVVSIAVDKMNVLYIGIENPITIAVSGVSSDKIIASINHGTIKGENGKYIAKLTEVKNAIIEISVDGKIISKQEFRVKRIPDPIAHVNHYSGSVNIPKSELDKIENVVAEIKNFSFDVNIDVVNFNISTSNSKYLNNKDKQSENITDCTNAMKELFKTAMVGDEIFISDIKIKFPDGTTRILSGINITVI